MVGTPNRFIELKESVDSIVCQDCVRVAPNLVHEFYEHGPGRDCEHCNGVGYVVEIGAGATVKEVESIFDLLIALCALVELAKSDPNQ